VPGEKDGIFYPPNWNDFDGELFQDLIVDLLTAEGYEVEPSGVGTDGGVDAFATQLIRFGYNNPERFVWAVQCKFSSDPKKSISPSAIGEVSNVVFDERFEAKNIAGYFLATNARLSINTMSQLRGLNRQSHRIRSTYIDRSRLHDLLTTHFKIYSKYFWARIEESAKQGSVPIDPILWFQQLIENPKTTETDLLAFFERHPQLLTRALRTGNEVLPQLRLRLDDGRVLLPDFLLSPQSDFEPWTILELKHPQSRVVTRQGMRHIMSATVHQSIAQLREYAAYFDSKDHRAVVSAIDGVDIFRPKVAVIIGMDYGGVGKEGIIRLKSVFPGVEILTYREVLDRLKGSDQAS
jgi:hypothetical protein